MALRVDARKQARWLELVHHWRRSELSVREFCRRQGLSKASFYFWRRMLQQRGLLEGQTQTQTPAFVKVTLAAPPADVSPIELLVGQHVLRVRPGFDAASLQELLRVLEEPAC